MKKRNRISNQERKKLIQLFRGKQPFKHKQKVIRNIDSHRFRVKSKPKGNVDLFVNLVFISVK